MTNKCNYCGLSDKKHPWGECKKFTPEDVYFEGEVQGYKRDKKGWEKNNDKQM